MLGTYTQPKRRSRWVAIAIASVLLAIGVAVGVRLASPARASPRHAAVTEETLPAEDPPAATTREETPAIATGAPRAKASPQPPRPEAAPSASPSAPAWPKAYAEDMPSALENAFAAEARDASWATAEQSQLLDVTRKIDRSQASIEEVECRTTLCRVSGSLVDANKRDDFMKHALFGPTATFASVPLAFYAPGGKTGDSSFRVYFLRQ